MTELIPLDQRIIIKTTKDVLARLLGQTVWLQIGAPYIVLACCYFAAAVNTVNNTEHESSMPLPPDWLPVIHKRFQIPFAFLHAAIATLMGQFTLLVAHLNPLPDQGAVKALCFGWGNATASRVDDEADSFDYSGLHPASASTVCLLPRTSRPQPVLRAGNFVQYEMKYKRAFIATVPEKEPVQAITNEQVWLQPLPLRPRLSGTGGVSIDLIRVRWTCFVLYADIY